MPQKRLKVVKGSLAGRTLWFDYEHAERMLAQRMAVEIADPAIQTVRYSDEERQEMGLPPEADERDDDASLAAADEAAAQPRTRRKKGDK